MVRLAGEGLADVFCPTICWELSAGLVTPVSLFPLHGETTTILQPLVKAPLLLPESHQPPAQLELWLWEVVAVLPVL